jgi:mono/diheme cytochrome c family protein
MKMEYRICRKAIVFILLLILSFVKTQTVFAQPSAWKAPAFVDTIHNPVPFSGPEMEDAKKIYNTTCWTCHGLDGKGTGPASVAITPKPADHTSQAVQSESDGALFWKISVGKGNMQPYRTLLTVKQRWALVNFIRTFSNTGNKSKLSQAQE